MDITLYEMGTSRSLRCRWTLKEVGLKYKSIDDRSLIRSDEIKKIHPLGKMPAALIDGMPLFADIKHFRCECKKVKDANFCQQVVAIKGTFMNVVMYAGAVAYHCEKMSRL